MAITDPTDITGLRAWWTIDQDIYSDAGTTPAGDGDGVQQWNDQSGNGYNFSQATAGDRPVKVEDITVGTAGHGLHFDNANSLMTASASVATPAITEGLIFMRLVLMDAVAGSIILSGNKSGSNAGDWQLSVQGSGIVTFYYNNISATVTSAANEVPLGEWTTIIVRLTATSAQLWIDGTMVDETLTAPSVGGNSQPLYMGEQTVGGNHSHIVVGELGFYDSAVNDTDRADLESYLSGRFVSPSISMDSRSDADMGAAQGVATDGTTWWTTGTSGGVDHRYIMEWTKSGDTYTLQSTTDTQSNWRAGTAQINSIHYASGYLYIGTNNYDTAPGVNSILIYDASDMSFVDRFDIDGDWVEGGSFGPNGNFFVQFDDELRFDEYTATDFTDDTTWSLDTQHSVATPSPSDSHRYNGSAWVGNLFLANWHDGITPQVVDVFKWTGGGLYRVYRLEAPTTNCGQGIHLDPVDGTKLYWAERNFGAGDHRVVESTISNFVGQSEPAAESTAPPRSGVAIANGIMMV